MDNREQNEKVLDAWKAFVKKKKLDKSEADDLDESYDEDSDK